MLAFDVDAGPGAVTHTAIHIPSMFLCAPALFYLAVTIAFFIVRTAFTSRRVPLLRTPDVTVNHKVLGYFATRICPLRAP